MGTIKDLLGKLSAQKEKESVDQKPTADLARQIIAELPDGVIGYDQNFKVIVFNPAAEKIFNLPADGVIGQIITPETLRKPGWTALTQTIFPSLAPSISQISEADEWPQVTDLESTNPLLSLRMILIRLKPDASQTISFLKIVKDRTREKEILKSKSEFIGVAAHQLRTPITAVNWAFENLIGLLSEQKEMKDALGVAQEGHDVAQRSLKIINDLLDVSKMEGGRFGFNFAEAEINIFLKTIIDGLKTVADYYKINLCFEPTPAACAIFIDQQKLGMAISNLIDNAIRYNSKNGEVWVIAEKETDGPFISILIKDTGVGIPPSEINKLFTKFYRGSNVVRLEPNGNGLGLYITKNIIEQHGGEIDVESTIGRGTTFKIKLPIDKNLVPQKELFVENY